MNLLHRFSLPNNMRIINRNESLSLSGCLLLMFLTSMSVIQFGPFLQAETDDESEIKLLVGKVTTVFDGDTLQFCPKVDEECTDDDLIEVDLWGVDAPELDLKKQFHAEEAKQYLESQVSDETVVLEVVSKDETNLQFVKVFIVNHPHSNLNLHLLLEGKGWANVPEESDSKEYELAEEFARDQRKGLWREVEPIEPWVWREQQAEGEKPETFGD